MTEMTLYVEVPPGADARKLAKAAETRLRTLSEIEDVEATPETKRVVVETLALIAIAVSFVRGVGDVADAVTKVNRALKELGFLHPKAEVGGKLVPVDEAVRAEKE
jgi:hypothetical protein